MANKKVRLTVFTADTEYSIKRERKQRKQPVRGLVLQPHKGCRWMLTRGNYSPTCMRAQTEPWVFTVNGGI